jgi:hypothetical protein
MAKSVLAHAGFAGTTLDVALGVSYAESGGYADAIGDYTQLQDPTIAAKWRISVGLFQIRALRDPNAWGVLDRWRVAESLLDRVYNAQAAYAISKQGTDWTPWSVFRSGSYLPHVGRDYTIKSGHSARAHFCD